MIVLDYNQIAIASMLMEIKKEKHLEEDLARHLILNSIRRIRSKFKREFGELVVCCDSTNYWRRSIFPYYKGLRKKEQNESEFDWNEIFRILNLVRKELALIMPFKILTVDTCEADDIIAVIARKSTKENPVLIVSKDGDFVQCHVFPGVRQYDQIGDAWVTCDDPVAALELKILKGDRGDSIPNVLSEDSAVVLGVRQQPMTQKRIRQFMIDKDIPEDVARRIERNRSLIDFNQIPSDIIEKIEHAIENTIPANGSQVFEYFRLKRLNALMEDLNSFM